MALTALRLRRAVYLSSSVLHLRTLSTPPPHSFITNHYPTLNSVPSSQSRHFRSSSLSLSSARSSFRNNNNNYDDEIGPDTILFEGCDYNHWLITMDFPKDPAPTREEMIETYLQTLAKVVGSYEEAKKKMYAFSTTTYQGFQCLVSEEESNKFKDLQGVVFILPDSYIDPVNKRYGGDQYDNGVITRMPPPMQYGRQGGKYDRRQNPNEQGARGYDNQGPRHGYNRNFGGQQNPSAPYQKSNGGYDNQGPGYGGNTNYGQQHNPQMPNQQPNPSFANQGRPTYGDNRNIGQHQNSTAQPNYGPSGGVRRDHLPTNNAPGGRDSVPPYQSYNYNQNQQGYPSPQGERVATEQRGYTGPPQGLTQSQGAGGSYGQMGGDNNVQGSGSNFGQMPGSNFGQGVGMNHSQGYQKNFSRHEEEMPPMEQRNNLQGEQRNYGQTGTYQGRY